MSDETEQLTKLVADWPLVEMVLATGAIGTAAFGIVEGLKGTPLGLVGFHRIRGSLGTAVMGAVDQAFGNDSRKMLQGFYRQSREGGSLGKSLRQGVRVGLRSSNAGDLALAVGEAVKPEDLAQAVSKLERGIKLEPEEEGVIGRFELAIDARIEAAMSLAQASYTAWMRFSASVVALLLAFVGTYAISPSGLEDVNHGVWILLGLAAVPLAPIAKDVAAGLGAARKAATAARKVKR